MTDAIALWNRDHANFAALLDLLERQLDLFHAGESPDYELMSDIMFYMSHYTDLVHHPREDLAFARIKQREPGVETVVDELSAQHAVLKRSGADLIRALEDIVNGSITSRANLEIPARAYLHTFRDHMRREETTLLPLAASLLRPRDWSAIDAEIRHVEDPLFGANAGERYAALRRQILREVRISDGAAL
ncbi:MAG TPA: hemerythrin domain-containing protein [Casimicrobiaceae bacterium]|nr:hemerythrin domain-containing protein [Casimicrobiaceae bacterium]